MGARLYVGNLSYGTTATALRVFLATDGRKVNEVTMPSDRLTGKPRGFAFVRMATEEDARSAIEALDGRELDGQRLRINEAREPGRPPRPGPFGGPGDRPGRGGRRSGAS